MKKTMLVLTILLTAAAFVGVFSMPALAIDGECYNCHTMHSSQDGKAGEGTKVEIRTYVQSSGIDYNRPVAQPYLLLADCIGCHVGAPDEIGMINTFDAPIVLHMTDPVGQGGTSTLAGGDFYWVAEVATGTDDTTGHNVAGISDQDSLIGFTPPGFDTAATPGLIPGDEAINDGASTWSIQLTCAGQNGCHGNHKDVNPNVGIFGAHHSNTGLTETRADGATTVGGSYRFLGGINGKEDKNWNWGETASTHNEYFGVNNPIGRDQSNSNYIGFKRTISYSCAQCHGFFHSRIDDSAPDPGSPWLRHPTDVELPNSGEYQYYNPDHGGEYRVEAPVARLLVPESSSPDVTPGTNAIVMCLSCHRAHGSPEPDLLRWDYDTMQAGTGTADTGCFTCHTEKNAD